MSDENIKPPLTYDSLAAKLSFIYDAKITIELKGNYLKQDKATFTHRNVVNSFTAYELHARSRDLNSKFTLGDCLFGAVKLTKNADRDKFGYSGYGIGFDSRPNISKNFERGKGVITFGLDNSLSVKIH